MNTPTELDPSKPPSDWLAVCDLFGAVLAPPSTERQAFIDPAVAPANVKADALSLLQHLTPTRLSATTGAVMHGAGSL